MSGQVAQTAATCTGGLFMLLLLILVYAITGMSSQTSIPHLGCLNPVIQTGAFEDKSFDGGWTLIQVLSSFVGLISCRLMCTKDIWTDGFTSIL
jgi:hypothetical protein